MTTKKYHHGDLKNALIQAAISLLHKEGADALSLRSVAAAAGVSHMAPYAHFKNKKQLLQSVAAWGFTALANKMERDARESSPREHPALSYGSTYISFALEHTALYRLMLGQLDTAGKRNSQKESSDIDRNTKGKDAASTLEESAQRPFALLQAAFANNITDPEQVRAQALGAWSLVHGMAALLIEGHFRIPDSMSVRDFLASAVIRAP